MADIVLINPRFDISYWGLEHAMPFLGVRAVLPVACLPLLAALTPAGHRVSLVDENVEPIDFDRCARADIVGVTGMNVQRRRIREILIELKSRGVFSVVGGAYVTVQEEGIADFADVIFIGEAEETWPRFLAEWGEGRHQSRYEQAERTDMATVPVPRLGLLNIKKYAFASVQFSRGCPFSCEFCDIIVTFGRRPRIKTVAQILAELEAIVAAGMNFAFVVDDNLIGNRRAIKEVLGEIAKWQREKGFPLMFATEASLDLADEPELLQLMVDANFSDVFVGIESPNEASLRETKKLQNLRARGGTMLDKVHRIQDAGIEVWCGIIVGFDNDEPSIFEAQRQFVQQSRIINAIVNMLVAIPRTPLYRRLAAEGRLDDAGDPADFGAFGTNVVPLRLSRDELRAGYVELMRDLNAPEAFFARVEALYLDAHLQVGRSRLAYMRRHPWRRLRLHGRLLFESAAILTLLMWGVPEKALRRQYRRAILHVAWRRRDNPEIIQSCAVKCAMHYHFHRMIERMEVPAPAIRKAA
jgi:radical SAM superfamily enzyme YgiQ (UPF0313 family)